MDWVRFGRSVRALRIRLGLRQVDLAASIGLAQPTISSVERGRGASLSGRSLERIAHALESRLVVRLDWNGEGLDRLLDAGHAQLVDQVVGALRAAGWEVIPEATFAIAGERGSIDVLAWHPASSTLLVVEIKSVVPDIQGTFAPLDRKVRLAPQIAGAHEWRPVRVGCLLVIGDTRTSRRRVEKHAATFAARFPDRVVAVRAFIARPGASTGLNGLWFLSFIGGPVARHRVARRRATLRA